MKSRLLLWSITASLAGFLFGFDTIVISGAEQKIQSVWNLDSAMHGLCAWAFSVGSFQIVPVCIFAFIAAHAVGQGAVIWVFISEIFPNRNRAAGQALGSSTQWLFAASLTLVFPSMVDALAPEVIFGFFSFMMVLQLLWVKMFVPETKGVPLEEMQARLGIAEEY